MQYVGQTCRALQKRFGEHYRRMKKPKLIDTFLYRHFKLTGHSSNDVLVQPVEKLTYDKNSSSRFKIIKRHETELKWIKLLQTPFPWALMIIFTTKVIFLKCLTLTCFPSWKFENVNLDHMVKGKREMANEKSAL